MTWSQLGKQARENGSNQVTTEFSFASNWLRVVPERGARAWFSRACRR